ncbi:DUF3291 domain-containing protein [Streptomyces sp. NPDC014894]|uniref:DUF3291 domain-containing protein n=1 Tax=Streptomyces sp. NPDC014894 TaxID=3364931 RepID=UPI0036FB481A
MPPLPWVKVNPAVPGTRAHVLASRLELKSFARIPDYLLKTVSVFRQLRGSPGALGVSLDARPGRRAFCTLSAWESREALDAYVRTEPHKNVMARLRPLLRATTFTSWEVPVEELPVDWTEARRRLDEQALADGRG